MYYTFNNLTYLSKVEYRRRGPDVPLICKNYLVTIEAGGKDGVIIDKIEDIVGLVKYASAGENGLSYPTERNWRK